jgi:apolipoprotein N-acyltransferase
MIKAGNKSNYFPRKKLIILLLFVAVPLVFTFSYGWYKIGKSESSRHLRVALVQANVLARNYMPLPDQVKHMRAYERLTREAGEKKPDLIVWPASSLPALISSDLVQSTLKRLTHETGAYLLVGGAGYEKFSARKDRTQRYTNSEYLISPSGQLEDQYHKIKLLAFNEYLPLEGIITWPEWITTLKESFIPGEKYTIFHVSGAGFSAPICWENLFPDLYRRFVMDGAQFMVSVTNEGFFGNTSGPYQSLAINVFRAVENRVTIARAATTGVSAFVNPDGKIVERVRDNNGKDILVSGVRVRDVFLSDKKTFYTVYGDIFAFVVIGMAVLMIFTSFFVQKRSPSRFKN